MHLYKNRYLFSDDTFQQQRAEKLLRRLAIGDRKQYKALLKEEIGQKEGSFIYQRLYESGVILKEFSVEPPLRSYPKEKIKKNLRHYVKEDKVRFSSNFDRFWYTFCIKYDEPDAIMEDIKMYFEKYVSYTYEELSCELIEHLYRCKRPQSYWNKRVEFDLIAYLPDGRMMVGECKWKNHRVIGKELIKLREKCDKVGLEPDIFALFSKNGYSKNMKKEIADDVLLFDLDDLMKGIR